MKRHFFTFLFVIFFMAASNIVVAQDSEKTTAAPSARLTKSDWEAVAGYFTSSANKKLTVEFTVADGILVARTLWNDGVIRFTPTSPLTFAGRDAQLNLTFHKGTSGQASEVEISGQEGLWIRENSFTASVSKAPKQIALPNAVLRPYEGLYQFADDPARFLRIFLRGDHIWARQEWDGGEVSFGAINDSSFFAPVAPQFTLDFERDGKAHIFRLIRFKQQKWLRCSKEALSLSEREALNGDYVSKDDPDNNIRLSGTGDQLVLTQLWDKKQVVLDEQTNVYFNNTKVPYPVVVLKDNTGKITGIVVLSTMTFVRKD